MSQPSIQPQIEAARAYEALMVPALFAEWAPRVLDAAGVGPGDRVLDIACGTGILAREAARRVGSRGSVTGVDPNPGMLHVASARAPAVAWHEGVAESLGLPDGSFDAVVSQFGMMFFGDRVAAVREALRVLAPGGRMAFAVWDTLENNPAYAAEVDIVERVAGVRAADALRAPFALGDRSALDSAFREAAVPDLAISAHRGEGRFPGIRVMVEADLRGWLPLMGIVLPEEQIASILEEATQVLDRHVSSDGDVSFQTSALIVTGRKPEGSP